jgi:hypothetical protein
MLQLVRAIVGVVSDILRLGVLFLSQWVAKSYSSGDRDLKQTATVLPPSVTIKRRRSGGWCGGCRCLIGLQFAVITLIAERPRNAGLLFTDKRYTINGK